MPVIIKDFEIVADAPPAAQPPAAEPGQPQASAAPLVPHDVFQILDYERQRELRVLAH